jgi:CHASE3 domain sensor protein
VGICYPKYSPWPVANFLLGSGFVMMIALYVVLVLSVIAVLGVPGAVFMHIRKKIASRASSEETQQIRAARERNKSGITEMRNNER